MGEIIFGLIAVTVGIGASYGLYWLLNALLSFLPEKILKRVQWIAFLTPALVLVTLVLLVPIVQTFIWSFMDKRVENYVGFDNYVALFTDPNFLSVLVNNFLWVLVVSCRCQSASWQRQPSGRSPTHTCPPAGQRWGS